MVVDRDRGTRRDQAAPARPQARIGVAADRGDVGAARPHGHSDVACMRGDVGQQVDHLVAEDEVEALADRRGLVGDLVADRPMAFQQLGAGHRFAGDVDADRRLEGVVVVEQAQEAALVAAVVQDSRGAEIVRYRDVRHAPPDRRMGGAHRLFVSGVAVPGGDRRRS